MKTPRSTALAERLLVGLCACSIVWFIGYEIGRYAGLQEARAQCIAPKQMKLDMKRTVEKRWINYWKAQS